MRSPAQNKFAPKSTEQTILVGQSYGGVAERLRHSVSNLVGSTCLRSNSIIQTTNHKPTANSAIYPPKVCTWALEGNSEGTCCRAVDPYLLKDNATWAERKWQSRVELCPLRTLWICWQVQFPDPKQLDYHCAKMGKNKEKRKLDKWINLQRSVLHAMTMKITYNKDMWFQYVVV